MPLRSPSGTLGKGSRNRRDGKRGYAVSTPQPGVSCTWAPNQGNPHGQPAPPPRVRIAPGSNPAVTPNQNSRGHLCLLLWPLQSEHPGSRSVAFPTMGQETGKVIHSSWALSKKTLFRRFFHLKTVTQTMTSHLASDHTSRKPEAACFPPTSPHPVTSIRKKAEGFKFSDR